MIKKLLSASLLAVFALGASAYEVSDYVYTRVAKYQVTGANLVTNGQFKDGANGTDSWVSPDAAVAIDETFLKKEGGPNGSNSLSVIEGQNARANGMYQVIPIVQGGTYVLTFKIMGATAGFTDIDLTGASSNYMNFYYNTDGSLATGRNDRGADAAGGYGNEFTFGTEDFQEMAMAVDAPAEGNLIIDFRAMATGVEIADVECHLVEQVYDNRVADRRLEYMNTFISAKDFTGVEYFEDLQMTIDEVKAGIENKATPEEMEVLMSNMELVYEEFIALNFGNYIDFIPTTDGSTPTGDNSSNWMSWTKKYNKLNSDYNGKAPWKWNTDRWCHKEAAANTDLGLNWQRGAGGNWNNIATLTLTLKPGEYFWGLSGNGGCMSLTGKSWDVSMARECVGIQMFLAGDTTEVVTLSPLYNRDLIYKFVVEGDGPQEVTAGIICNTTVEEKEGFKANLYSPVLLKLLEPGEFTPEEELNITTVHNQLETMATAMDKAKAYLADDQVLLPWGKEDLQFAVDTAQIRYDAWVVLDSFAICDLYSENNILGDTIKNVGINYVNNAIKAFESLNVPLTDMPKAIEAANKTKEERIYSGSAKMAELNQKIADAQTLYDTSLKLAYSEDVVLALQNMKAELAAAVEEFKAAITGTTIVDINFGTQENPDSIIEVTDTAGVTVKYIDSTFGRLFIANGDYELGYNGTDSLGMLRVGNGEVYADFTGTPANPGHIVRIQFDLFPGNLSKKYVGFKILGEEREDTAANKVVRDTICALYYSPYTGDAKINTLGIDWGRLPKVGSGSASNAAIAAASNSAHFDIILDYGAKVMYCTTFAKDASKTTEAMTLPAHITPSRFVLYSDYNNGDRRSWFDNLLIQDIAAEIPAGIEEIRTAVVTGKNTAIYNLAGQRLAAPVKGQIYIQNGKKYLAK